MDSRATLFVRLAGPLQAWGQSALYERRTRGTPSKSGVIGLLCCCLGMRRNGSFDESSPYAASGITVKSLNELALGVRVDRPGMLMKDWQAVGARDGIMSADGRLKETQKTHEPEQIVSNRYYLCDAEFLAALAGAPATLETVREALHRPHWPPYLGRKCCLPSVPLTNPNDRLEPHATLDVALASRLLYRHCGEPVGETVERDCFIEGDGSCRDATVENDVRPSYASWARAWRHTRFCRVSVSVKNDPFACLRSGDSPPRNPDLWDKKRLQRAVADKGRCVLCARPARDCHHRTYKNYPNNEDFRADLRSLCPLCHRAISQLETLYDMGVERIDPLDAGFSAAIVVRRERILTDHMKLRSGQRRLYGPV